MRNVALWLASHMSNVDHEGTDLVTTAEAARIVGKSVATVNRWADSGSLPTAVKAPGVRGARLFRRADVVALAGSAAA